MFAGPGTDRGYNAIHFTAAANVWVQQASQPLCVPDCLSVSDCHACLCVQVAVLDCENAKFEHRAGQLKP